MEGIPFSYSTANWNRYLLHFKKEYIDEIDYKEFPISSDLERRSHNKKVFHSNQHPTMEFGKARLQVKGRARSGENSVKLTPE